MRSMSEESTILEPHLLSETSLNAYLQDWLCVDSVDSTECDKIQGLLDHEPGAISHMDV